MDQAEKLALGTHLYTKLRRTHNRVIDVVWMFQNRDYAQEVLRLARSAADPDMGRLADRLQALIENRPSAPLLRAPPRLPAYPAPEPEPEIEPEVAQHYIGALR